MTIQFNVDRIANPEVRTVSCAGRTWPPTPLPIAISRKVRTADDNRRDVETIIAEVSGKHGMTPKELISKGSFRHISEARREAYWRIRTETGLSFPEIGRHFGGRHHTTVLNGFLKHEERMAEEAPRWTVGYEADE